MGYTHYWRLDLNRATPEQFAALAQIARRLFVHAAEFGPVLWSEYDKPGSAPEVGEGVIRFNGPGSQGHETLYFDATPNVEPEHPRDSGHDYEWFRYDWTVREGGWRNDFTKTARKPYDAVVGAFLIAAKEVYGDVIEVGSDGADEWGCEARLPQGTWRECREFYSAALGGREAPGPWGAP